MQRIELSATKLHELGEKLREEDKLENALICLNLALAKYTEQKDFKGKIDCLQSRFLTWKHLYLTSKNKKYLTDARKDVKDSMTLAKRMGLKNFFYKCNFRFGELCMLEGDYETAVRYYKKALIDYRGPLSEKGDYRYHLGEALYRSGIKDQGYKTILKGLVEIEEGKDGVDSFLYNVWRSGCLMRTAELLRNDNLRKAKEYLKLASVTVNSDKRLVIRKRQLKDLKNLFKARPVPASCPIG